MNKNNTCDGLTPEERQARFLATLTKQPPQKFVVEMLAFGDPGELRTVEVPYSAMHGQDEATIRELVFHFGQNDVQPQQHPSVSVGDVLRMYGQRWIVKPAGFELLSATCSE
jgi:hypothetical protein